MDEPQPLSRPLRILELREADGPGGGPEKTILYGASLSDPGRFQIKVCYIRAVDDSCTSIAERAQKWGVDYCELRQRGKFDLGLWRQLAALVEREQFDLVHAHEYKTTFLTYLLARRQNIVPFATTHGWGAGHSFQERRVYYPLERRLFRKFPVVISVSSVITGQLIETGVPAERIHTIPNAVDPQQFRPQPSQRQATRTAWGVSDDDVVIGAVGRLEPEKQFGGLIEVFAELTAGSRNFRLLIAGEGSQRQQLQQRIDQCGLGDSCKLLGHCDNIVEFYAGLDLFVQSSSSEGTPNVVLEAMAMEVPVVVTNAGGTTDLFATGREGWVVPVLDMPALKRALQEALQDPAERDRRKTAARKHVETALSFERRTRKLEELYQLAYNQSHGISLDTVSASSS